MKKLSGSRARRIGKATSRHSHASGSCLNILRQLSAYIDDELPSQICRELRLHLGACPNCEVFVASLRDTITLCRHRPTPPLSPSDRAAIRHEILLAAKSGARQ
jgi:anti-sigma factor RsiW